MICPKCGSENVDVQLHQENTGSKTVTRTKSKYKEKGHGVLWWVCVGWWWWVVDLILWVVFLIPRLFARIFKRKKYTGDEKTISKTKNKTAYRTVCVCKDCGHHWTA